jgi:hypothetical protein
MQAVHVLRDQRERDERLQPGQRVVRGVRLGPAEVPPADQAAGPVAGPHVRVGHERLELDRPLPLPLPVDAAVIRDP